MLGLSLGLTFLANKIAEAMGFMTWDDASDVTWDEANDVEWDDLL